MSRDNSIVFRSPHFLFLFIIVGFITLTYFPALFHGPRADHWDYLLDMQSYHSCYDTLLHSYSYNRTRTFGAGDALLFRPLLFTYLAFVDCTIRTHFMLIQTIGMVIHLAICLLLYSFLANLAHFLETNHVAKKYIPGVVTLIFASSPFNVEQVSWNHIQGYMISTLLVLTLIQFVAKALFTHTLSLKNYFILWTLCLLACFFYEANNAIPLLIGTLFLTSKISPQKYNRVKGCFFFVIPLFYIALDYIDYHFHLNTFTHSASSSHFILSLFSSETPINILRFLRYTFVLPSISLHPTIGIGPRLQIHETTQWLFSGMGGITTTILILFTALIIYSFLNLAREKRHAVFCLFFLLIGWLTAYTLINVLGRMNGTQSNSTVLAANPYYAYIPTLIACITLAVSGFILLQKNQINKATALFLILLFSIYLLLRGIIIFHINHKQAKLQADFIHSVQFVNQLRSRNPSSPLPLDLIAQSDLIHGIHKLKIIYS